MNITSYSFNYVPYVEGDDMELTEDDFTLPMTIAEQVHRAMAIVDEIFGNTRVSGP